MVVNFKAHGISRGARKLTRTLTLIIIKKSSNNKNLKNICDKIQKLQICNIF